MSARPGVPLRRRRVQPVTHERDPDWRDKALCAQVADPSIFFPAAGAAIHCEKAKQVCRRCPVIIDCLDWAMTRKEQHGVWGGLSENERANIRRNRRTTL